MFSSPVSARSRTSPYLPRNVLAPRAKSASPLLLAGLFATALCVGPAFADNEDHKAGAVRLLGSIPIPGAALHGFDISWVDADTQRYYLADRSNTAVDVVDAKKGTFLKQISGGFAGVKFNASGAANNDISGPNGVVTSGRWLFVTDAPSRVVSIDLNTDLIVDTVFTSASPNRADELAYDPDSGTLLVVNNADDPPFATLIKVNKSTGKLTLGAKITFDAAHGVDATNGAEQPVWNKATGKFYISIPQIGANARRGWSGGSNFAECRRRGCGISGAVLPAGGTGPRSKAGSTAWLQCRL